MQTRRALVLGAALTLPAAVALPAGTAHAASGPGIQHVLYLSVDGLRQTDLARYTAENPGSVMAQLARGGVEYSDASTSEPSDSFPGLLAAFTGAGPRYTGVYYDVTYSRGLYPPASGCQGAPGTTVAYDESIDQGWTGTDSGTLPIIQPDGTTDPINQSALPERLVNGVCSPLLPSDYLAVNTVFGVAASHGLYTAYTDKHPAYEIVNGPGTPGVVNDFYGPEINAEQVPSQLTVSRGPGQQDNVSFPVNSGNYINPTTQYAITDSVADTESYDQIKVDSILNEIDGLRSNGTPTTPAATVPAIFGMNFQTVSVGQKLVDPLQSCTRTTPGVTCNPSYMPGGYMPKSGDFTPQLRGALDSVDAQLGEIVNEIDAKGLASSTEIILSAKHGQAPLNPADDKNVGDILPNYVGSSSSVVQDTSDDIGLLWLANSATDKSAAANLVANAAQDHAETVYQGGRQPVTPGARSIVPLFGYPTPGSLVADREPDVIVEPQHGVIYSGSKAKVAEHGGFHTGDLNVALVVDAGVPTLTAPGSATAAPSSTTGVYTGPVTTYQIAPSILQALGLPITALAGANEQQTTPLPTPGPNPALPEAPLPALLAVPALAAVGGTVVVRRRRAARREA